MVESVQVPIAEKPSNLVDYLSDYTHPLRLDAAGHESLLQKIRELAVGSIDSIAPSSRSVLIRFRGNCARLKEVHRELALRAALGEQIPSESEWLLDNYYIIQEVVREIRNDLPKGYYRELPALLSGPFARLPRICPFAFSLLAYTDSAFTESDITEAVTEYQRVAPLSIGEIWAIPTMLRLALLENLRRIADQIVSTIKEHRSATAAVLLANKGSQPLLPTQPTDAFAVAFWEGLRDGDNTSAVRSDLVHDWLSEHIADPGKIEHREYCRQAANQVSIGNAITSLRLLGVIDWMNFFESVSLVEAELRRDPAGIYGRQDFGTRDRCRQAVEKLSRQSKISELDIVKRANHQAELSKSTSPLPNASFLIGEHRQVFAQSLKPIPFWKMSRQDWLLEHPNLFFFGLLGSLTALLVISAIALSGASSISLIVLVALAALLPASELAVGFSNFFITRQLAPRVLPKLDFKNGIANGCDTFVVIPTLLTRPEQAAVLCERLELHYLSNSDPKLRFALLTDFPDADAEQTPSDDPSLQTALEGIQKLNELHAEENSPRFFLFHRRRLWNPSQNCWMGWERKRGKLEEFNSLLRGDKNTTYSIQSSVIDKLPPIRYVLTLDGDTVLPRDAARQMIATLAHPLNQPILSEDKRRVISGFGLLQPRVSFLYKTGFQSWFASLFAGSAGIDPYSAAVSDTYMDLFAKGTFTGKGLYDIDAFQATSGQAFPENAILSHDLIESNYTRCALATDVEVFDEFPSRYNSYARREHRWIRGDWQLLPWLSRRVPTSSGEAINILPALERWKIIDNLRRSLVPASLVLLLLLAATILPGQFLGWCGFVMILFAWPTIFYLLETALLKLHGKSSRSLIARLRADLPSTLGQSALQFAFLPNQAWVAIHAIGTTLYRLNFSRKKLLEWETAAAAEVRLGTQFKAFLHSMFPAVIISLVCLLLVGISHLSNLIYFAPIGLLWLMSPLIAWRISQPRQFLERSLTEEERLELRLVCRKTWNFFETFVGDADNHLPPDNYQEDPLSAVAHRTSPTNIGLYLLSVLAAHDLGYLTLPQMLERLRKTFASIQKLEKYRGHLLNWYETTTLETLQPGYVSTVDSGNLLACLLTLKQGLLEKMRTPPQSTPEGLRDTCELFLKALSEPAHNDPKLKQQAEELRKALLTKFKLTEIQSSLVSLQSKSLSSHPEAEVWLSRLSQQVQQQLLLDQQPTEQSVGCPKEMAEIAEEAERLAKGMDFRFLYNAERDLFSIGYNCNTQRLDTSHYDLLASESCIASFLAVARGQVPRKHWFQLGRLSMYAAGETGLISWGGTMFEYLMPRILLPVPQGVLLDRAQRTAVARQIEFGAEEKLPWGVSESGFYLLDAGKIYQYQSFGVPGLGLKRGLEKDRVVAPYATLMAVDIDPQKAIANLKELKKWGGEGKFGYYEALDFSPQRIPEGSKCRVVKSYMAHHQGMGLLAILNRLTQGALRRRFQAEPVVRSAELLLQERIPNDFPIFEPEVATVEDQQLSTFNAPSRRRITTPDTPVPRTHLLSNGLYTVMITNSGAGFSRYGDIDITFFRADRTTDDCGQVIYLRDRRSGKIWSVGYQPIRKKTSHYEVIFSLDKADIRQFDDGIETHLEITVPPDQNVEIRRLSIANQSARQVRLDATSYAEIVLNDHRADMAHPVFGKLFLETEWVPQYCALLCQRRPRTPNQKTGWAMHLLVCDSGAGSLSWDTDRRKFLGRRRSTTDAISLEPDWEALSETAGPVLDPIFSIRREVRLKPGEKKTLTFVTGWADSREAALTLAEHYHSMASITRAFELSWAHSRIELQHSQLRAEDVHLFQRLAGHLIYPVSPLRAKSELMITNREGQSGLWRFGISGDLPILLLQLHSPAGMPIVRQLLQAHSFWNSKGLRIDLLIFCETASGYQDDLYSEAVSTTRSIGLGDRIDQPAGIFIRKAAQMSQTDRTLLLTSARVVLNDEIGPLAEQIDNPEPIKPLPPKAYFPLAAPNRYGVVELPRKIQFGNETGCFTGDGLEYLIAPRDASRIPTLPWSNVIANPNAGFLVTDSGSGFAWAGNSQANRLTPWSNDPVSDPPGEIIYLQSQSTGNIWCPTPLPIRDGGNILVRHGQGYSAFERVVNDVSHELTLFVPKSDPVKISVLKLINQGNRPVKLNVVYYLEWVLGTNREITTPYIICEQDPETQALFARNAFTAHNQDRLAFAASNMKELSFTADRTEFLGRNGSVTNPISFQRENLSGRTGPGLDPCAALRGSVTLEPKGEQEIIFLLGEVQGESEARKIIQKYLDSATAEQSLEEVVSQWDDICGKIQVQTPDPAFDLMMNRWLIYQTLSCRFWARSAFYQSGGAYGFRDQLQDVVALIHSAPEITRAHILKAASRQFVEGDVQHWWHEPQGNGVRTTFSDDFLWLVYVSCHYATVTGDLSLFQEEISFLRSPVLSETEHERYEVPEKSDESAPLYEHCKRALEHGWKLGSHGLPLMGCGDWNDGMSSVGVKGKGESIWVAWFQIYCHREFARIADLCGDTETAKLSRQRMSQLQAAVESQGYDGDWYLRAYFDDGTALGSHKNDECQLDSIVQSWAVISEAADKERAEKGMAAVLAQLVRLSDRLVELFKPPFDRGPLQPGYIKGYVPGVRENGGQYNHAVTWVIKALAKLRRNKDAYDIFNLLNPVRSTTTPEAVTRYGGEPYVIAADVYSCPPHVGRVGWTWYTGSAAWYYRVGLEDILGLNRTGDELRLNPCLPEDWPEVSISYYFGKTLYRIQIDNRNHQPGSTVRLSLDGLELPELTIPLREDGETHEVLLSYRKAIAKQETVGVGSFKSPSVKLQ
ncbi:glycosyl transferase family 36 [Telmatocola sphagniphila]|uniref:Glycosyl transferase family 36 n=1 Tax=Telmatocola sphagniphila TaxID=1123043 RepID=A0A8E6B9W9_9BACT|nr:glucoamylase family protein [Telmatocola sphagniphila]QVL34572.1 glycosyl transferase family 36 [Telmatocola sphagniphila]